MTEGSGIEMCELQKCSMSEFILNSVSKGCQWNGNALMRIILASSTLDNVYYIAYVANILVLFEVTLISELAVVCVILRFALQ
jgi:hypothetical protein